MKISPLKFEENSENKSIVVFLPVRVDSAVSTEIEDNISEILKDKEGYDITFDATDMEYTSSAGLRIVMATKKRYPSLKIVNAREEVYEIFDVTGFTTMMEIAKN